MTTEELTTLGQEWQRRLRLQDWRIDYQFKRGHEMSNSDCLGECARNTENKVATITLRDPIDYHEPAFLPYDEEETLVHELVHVEFPTIRYSGGNAEDILLEQGINMLALALVELKREAKTNA